VAPAFGAFRSRGDTRNNARPDLAPLELEQLRRNVRLARHHKYRLAEPGATKHGLSPWFWVAGSVGAAGLVTGAVSGALLLDARSTVRKSCHPLETNKLGQIPCEPAGYDAANLAQGTLAPVTTIALGVGAAGVLTAVVLYVTDGSRGRPTQGALPTISVGPGLASIGLQSVF